MIAIIDYGMGNLHSVQKAIERLGFEGIITSEKDQILKANGLILPGVGAFGDAMVNLEQSGLIPTIRDVIKNGTPLLGICLGMQLLFETSEEHGIYRGLGVLKGHVKRFKGDFKIPHMGWNSLNLRQKNHFLFENGLEGYVYFVHSYYVDDIDEDILLAYTDYYGLVPAIVGYGNVIGMQFHPEKSGSVGMELLKRFLVWSEKQ